jgi:hypothetical protein
MKIKIVVDDDENVMAMALVSHGRVLRIAMPDGAEAFEGFANCRTAIPPEGASEEDVHQMFDEVAQMTGMVEGNAERMTTGGLLDDEDLLDA